MQSSKGSLDASAGVAAGGTATFLGFQVNLRTAIALAMIGLVVTSPLLNPGGPDLLENHHDYFKTRRILRDLRWGNDDDLAEDITDDEEIEGRRAIDIGIAAHWEVRDNDKIPVFVEHVTQLAEVAIADFNALMHGFPPLLHFHNLGRLWVTRYRAWAQQPWRNANGAVPVGMSCPFGKRV